MLLMFFLETIVYQIKKKILPGVGHLPLSCWSEVSQRLTKQYRILPGIVSCLPEFTKQETLNEI